MLRKAGLIIIIFFCLSIVNNAIAATAKDARQFVDNIGKDVLNIINDSSKNDSQKKAQLRQMFSETVDIPWMGRFVLGVGWNQATEGQRTKYMQVYQKYMEEHYTSNFSDYTGSKYTITDVKSKKEGQFTVNMQIKTAKQSADTFAGYRLQATNDGKFKITDIIIEGVSLLVTQRSDFASVIHQKGMDGLISSIEGKIGTENRGGKL